MNLLELRGEIDRVDDEMTRLFCRRMELVREVADYKRVHAVPILHSDREEQILQRVQSLAGPGLADEARCLFTVLMDLSKASQNAFLLAGTEDSAFGDFDRAGTGLPDAPVVACQGVDGAYSGHAARGLFPGATLRFYAGFDEVFHAVEQGDCALGVLPIENSTAGSVNSSYDLLRGSRCRIVREAKLEIAHCLLTKPGVRVEQITDVYSHEQALAQCGDYLRAHPKLRVHPYSNTAAAARFVAEGQNPYAAAIASRTCAAGYGLDVAEEKICNALRNYTRFIAISRAPLVTQDADKISVTFTLPHVSGSLYRVIAQCAARGLNLTKLESRPLPDTNFEFQFYFDFEGRLDQPGVKGLLRRLQSQCSSFTLLGNYRELTIFDESSHLPGQK